MSVTIDEHVTEADLHRISVRLIYLKSASKKMLVPSLRLVDSTSAKEV